MDIATIRSAMLWCTVINYCILILWVLIAWLGHDWMCSVLNKLFRVSAGQVEQVNFVGISFYKAIVIIFNLVPLLALLIVRC